MPDILVRGVSTDLKSRLEAGADANGRSLSEEVVARLMESETTAAARLPRPSTGVEFLARLDAITAEIGSFDDVVIPEREPLFPFRNPVE